MITDYREDFLPLRAKIDPDSGYITDSPVLTRVGVFEYANPRTGKMEKEFRPSSVVFDPAHLRALRGTPIVATHASGLISSKNVRGATVGVILSEGRRDGDNLVADIVVHHTDPIVIDGMRELSLGYLVDVDETPGTFNGERYDRALSRLNSVNHLAIVKKGRAGVARINMDQEDRPGRLSLDAASSAAARARMMIRTGVNMDTAMWQCGLVTRDDQEQRQRADAALFARLDAAKAERKAQFQTRLDEQVRQEVSRYSGIRTDHSNPHEASAEAARRRMNDHWAAVKADSETDSKATRRADSSIDQQEVRANPTPSAAEARERMLRGT